MNRLQYLLYSAVLITGILVIVHLSNQRQALEQELLEQFQEMQSLLDEAESQNSELRRMLRDRPPWLLPDDYERVFRVLDKPALSGMGEAFCKAETETGVSSLVLAAIVAHESGWGTSALARCKNNLAGLGAFDGSEYASAIYFDDRADSVMYLARLLEGSEDLQEVGNWYASDPAWLEKVISVMRLIVGVAM